MLEPVLTWVMQGNAVEWFTMLGEWAIVVAILYEGQVALKEYRSARLFEAIKYVEDEHTRKARRTLWKHLQAGGDTSHEQKWWDHNADLAEAASTVAARYNLLGAVTREDQSLRAFVVKEWANNICYTYEALREYLEYREASNSGRPGLFRRYQELYNEAKQVH